MKCLKRLPQIIGSLLLLCFFSVAFAQNAEVKKPLIGILLNDGGKGGYSDYPWYAIRQNYGKMVIKNGGIPVYLGFETSLVDYYVDVLDGILLTGGDFPSPPEVLTTGVKGEISSEKYPRSAFEYKLVRKAYEKDIPILGICGGTQDMNAGLGGVLIENLSKTLKTKIQHRQENREKLQHGITIDPKSKLFSIMKKETMKVNSNHTAGIKSVPSTLKISARATDGVIEAIEAPNKRFFIGVMWHPEFALTPEEGYLWKAFVDAASEYQKTKQQ